MLLKRLIAFLLGTLRIEVRGPQIARFLNLAARESLSLWNIEWVSDRVRATISVPDFRRLRPVARGSRCRVHILIRRGLPFRAARLASRPVLAAGAAACALFLFWAAAHVWVVSVKLTGPQNLDQRAVLAVAAEAGLKSGVWKGRVDVLKVQEQIQKRMGEVAWAAIRITGTRAVIEIVEKPTRLPQGETGCVNLVAERDGVIEQVIPFRGEPAVKQGDIVKAGDLLVECSLRYWSGGRPAVIPGMPKPPRDGVARTLIAQAIVKARVVRTETKEIPLIQSVPAPTGRTATQWVLKWKDKPIISRGRAEVPFDRYEGQRRVYSLGSWRNWKPPVELVISRVEEVTLRTERVDLAQAVRQAEEQVSDWLRWVLSPADELVTPVKAQIIEQTPDYAVVRVTVETLEDIAQPTRP